MSAAPDWPIVTERLLLRSYGDGEFDGLYAIESSDTVARWLYNDARNAAETRDLLARKIRGAMLEAEGDWLSVAVTLRDTEQARLTDFAYTEAVRLLSQHRVALDRVATALLEHETLAREELVALFDGVERDSQSSDSVGVVRALGADPTG